MWFDWNHSHFPFASKRTCCNPYGYYVYYTHRYTCVRACIHRVWYSCQWVLLSYFLRISHVIILVSSCICILCPCAYYLTQKTGQNIYWDWWNVLEVCIGPCLNIIILIEKVSYRTYKGIVPCNHTMWMYRCIRIIYIAWSLLDVSLMFVLVYF